MDQRLERAGKGKLLLGLPPAGGRGLSGAILIVDDDQAMCELAEADLRRRGFEVAWFLDPEEGLAALSARNFDVVLTDLNMPSMHGIELCQRAVGMRPDVPVVVITAFGSMEAAVAAIRSGAYDFVTKPIEMDLLALTLARAVRHHALQDQLESLTAAAERATRFDRLIGESPPMRALFELLARVADSESTVLLTGESGTGKELAAKGLHERSRRRSLPFVAVNCAAIPKDLMESELFGHVRGAFTGAGAERRGLFVQAHRGTLLLDEIAELPLELQPKLLRALEEGRVRPVGSESELPCDVRLIAATNRDLESAVEGGRFRKDLFYRINVVRLELPPLRARGADVLLLARHFLEEHAARTGGAPAEMSPAFAERLLAYPWPGNVRELRNAIERALALRRYDKLVIEDLPDKIRDHRSQDLVVAGSDPSELVSLEEVERRYILHVLGATGGNRTLAARILGLDRKTLYRKLLQYGNDESP